MISGTYYIYIIPIFALCGIHSKLMLRSDAADPVPFVKKILKFVSVTPQCRLLLWFRFFRSYIVALCIVTILWIPVVKAAQGGQLFTYIVVVEGFIAAPLPILFLFAVFWDRCTEKVYFT